jgi:hypothetical protein
MAELISSTDRLYTIQKLSQATRVERGRAYDFRNLLGSVCIE